MVKNKICFIKELKEERFNKAKKYIMKGELSKENEISNFLMVFTCFLLSMITFSVVFQKSNLITNSIVIGFAVLSLISLEIIFSKNKLTKKILYSFLINSGIDDNSIQVRSSILSFFYEITIFDKDKNIKKIIRLKSNENPEKLIKELSNILEE